MANHDNLKQLIRDSIYSNDSKAITGNLLQSVLLQMVSDLGSDVECYLPLTGGTITGRLEVGSLVKTGGTSWNTMMRTTTHPQMIMRVKKTPLNPHHQYRLPHPYGAAGTTVSGKRLFGVC